jgi:hypothetical protein
MFPIPPHFVPYALLKGMYGLGNLEYNILYVGQYSDFILLVFKNWQKCGGENQGAQKPQKNDFSQKKKKCNFDIIVP